MLKVQTSGILGKIETLSHGASIHVDITVKNGELFYAGMGLAVLSASNLTNRGSLKVMSLEGNHLFCSELPAGTSQGDYLQVPGAA